MRNLFFRGVASRSDSRLISDEEICRSCLMPPRAPCRPTNTIFLLRRKRSVSHENMLHQKVSDDTTTLSFLNPDTCQPRQPRSMVSEVQLQTVRADEAHGTRPPV